MLNMEYQLKGQSTPHLLDEVLVEIQNVRRDAGYPALAIPASEILGTQAMFNVLHGKYSVITSEFADLMLGYYGTTLGEKDRKCGRKQRPARTRPLSLAVRLTCSSHRGRDGEPRPWRSAVTAAMKMC
jgi:methylmalonyl-CoA carboxyltransferase 5S subunit